MSEPIGETPDIPRRAYRLVLDLEADDYTELLNALDGIGLQLAMEPRPLSTRLARRMDGRGMSDDEYDWRPVYRDGIPVEMRLSARPKGRPSLCCPRTFPHAAHGPWHDGMARDVFDPAAGGFDCPGVDWAAVSP